MALSLYCWGTLALLCVARGLQITAPLDRFKRSSEEEPGSCGPVSRRQPLFRGNSDNFTVDLRMPRVLPAHSDVYLCMAFPVPVTNQEVYIVDFTPYASMDTVHHMLLFSCQSPVSTSGSWDCGSSQGTCEDESSIMYAWARNAPPTKLPKDVGFKVGGHSGMSYFVLQIHYGDVSAFRDHHRDCSGLSLTLTTKPQPFIAGIYLLMTVDTVIPPGNKVINADSACDFTSYPMYPFAFRTHTHRLGKVVSGYRVRDGKWTLIGRQSPQLPQAFYPANKDADIKYGDTIAARCVFTGEGKTSKTYIGGTSDDEMCNFYIMYYMDHQHAVPFFNCMKTGSTELFQGIPPEANIPIAVPPSLMHSMMHMGHSDHKGQAPQDAAQSLDQGDLYSLILKLLGQSKDLGYFSKFSSSAALRAQDARLAQLKNLLDKELASPFSAKLVYSPREDPVLVRDRVHKFHQLEDMAKPARSMLLANGEFHLEQVTEWPEEELKLGQVSGLAIDSSSNLVIFHRGDHYWDHRSFDSRGRYQQQSLGPIQQSTILVVDAVKGTSLQASGRNMFYLPHGITTDGDSYWVTDVALHQVFKVSADGRAEKLLTLGEPFVPGSDHHHFCQPTDVAVDPESGNVFISDGYCNDRILKFSADGKYLSEWGAGHSDRRRRVPFRIPHSVVFLPDRREVCVADRENGRIQCFIAETGEFVKEFKKEEFSGKVFAIAYSPVGDGLIFAVNGESLSRTAALKGFVISYSTKNIIDTFQPENKDFKMPHDIAVTRDSSVFVGDVSNRAVYKFTSEKTHRSVKKAGIEVQELEEVEAFVQAKLKPAPKPKPRPDAAVSTMTPQKQNAAAPPTHKTALETEKKKTVANAEKDSGMFPAVMTTLLLVPLLLVMVMAAFICYRKRNQFEVKAEPPSVGGILGKLRGKAVGSLNLGNFFAAHKGYSRQGFDQLSTEGSDQERIDEDSSDSENEEYSALPPPRTS